MSNPAIPLIDMREAHVLPARLLQAYGEVGFAYVTGHGIPQARIEAIFAASQKFHALPLEQKMAVALDQNHRGYIPIATSTDRTSTLAEVRRPNQSESFMVMREAGPDDPQIVSGAFLAGPNQWPDLPGFREDVEGYLAAMTALAGRVIQAFADSLDLDPAALAAPFQPPTLWLRLLHYPPQPAASPDDLFGSAPHTDWGAITLLAQDDVGGLQVMTDEGDWIDVPPRLGTFILNVGDMLHRYSNGVLRSTPHRVINRTGRERYSCAFFYDPSVEAGVAPFAQLVTAERPAAYEPMNYGDFLRHQLGSTYDRHGGEPGQN